MPESEIDFLLLAKTLWTSRKLIGKIILISVLLGFSVTFLIPVRYTATTLMVEQSADPKITLNEERLSAITALSAMAGVNVQRLTKGTMAPQTYTNLVASTPFQTALLNSKIHTGKSDNQTTVQDYLKQARIKQPLTKLLSVQILDDQFILIKGTLKDPHAAAELTKNAQQQLIQFLTELQTAKAHENLNTLQQRLDSATTYLQTLTNQKTSEHQIEQDLTKAQLFELNQQLQTAQTTLTQLTPLFKIIEPVSIPTQKSSPKTAKLIALFAFFGLALAMTIILGKGFISDTKAKWNNNQ